MARVSWAASVWIMFVFPVCTGAQDLPFTTCKEYIFEGETLTCLCLGGCANGATPTRTWPGHSDTNRLEKTNITRDNNGQNFTCQKVCGTQTTEIIYTLRVAYGPDAASTKITGPSPFITNGTLSMTLTCETSTNPSPYYSWSGVRCDNGNGDSTCIFTPPIEDDGKRATCEVTNPENSQAGLVSVAFNINLSYPPFDAPVISGYTPGHIVKTGDNLTCTVTGGKPLVDRVNFYCSDHVHTDQQHTTQGTSVSNSLTIDVTNVTKETENFTCHCSGYWAPEDGLYTLNTNVTFYTEYDPLPVAIGAIVGGTVAALVVIIIIIVIACCCRGKRKGPDKQNLHTKHNEGVVNPKYVEDGSGSGSNHDNDSGIEMNGGSSPLEMSPRQSGGAGYASLSDYPPSGQHSGEFRKKSARAAAYEVTSITSTGKVNIKPAAPQPNAYQDPWDIKKGDMAQAGAPGGFPTPHNVGPEGDEYPTISNANNKTTITVGPKGDVYSTIVKHAKGDNAQGSPAKTQGQEDAAASRGPPLSMTPHPLDTPGYATLAQMAPDQEKQGDVTSSSGDTAASGSPVKNTSSSGEGTDFYDHVQRDGHDPKSMSQGPGVQYSHIGNY